MAPRITNKDKALIIQRSAEGASKVAIAAEVGCHPATVQRCRDDNRSRIERIRERVMMEGGEDAVDNILHAVKAYKAPRKIKVEIADEDGMVSEELRDNVEFDAQLRDHGFKASQLILQAAGALPTNAPSVFVQQVYNDNRTVAPPEILEVLKALNRREEIGSLIIEAEEDESDGL